MATTGEETVGEEAEEAAPEESEKFPREIPWCIIFLSVGAIACHCLVLYGNIQTAGSIEDIGKSVRGWSRVGTGLADALHEELDELLNNVTIQLTEAINRTMQTMDMIDGILALMGGTAMNASAVALHRIALLEGQGSAVADPFSSIMETVVSVLSNLPTFQECLMYLQQFMQNLKPGLEQVGIWVETFADKVQASVEIFGTTMDKVTKIFDSIMSEISDTAGEGADLMQHETFNLFDTNGDGSISQDDLQNCASIYAVPALQGAKAKDLIEKYDANGDGELSPGPDEFGLMVEDESISGIMATVLRAYAKRLSMVAGNVGAARMRDEVASSVVKYFQLVCSKNLTKVGWISDMLTNATLPMAFTADVMAELALQKDDPNVLTTADVGEIVVGMMMTLNSDYTNEAYELMSTAEHWSTEGFDEDDQPQVVEQVQSWMQSGPDAVKELEKHMVAKERHNKPDVRNSMLIETDGGAELDTLSSSERDVIAVMDAMPAVARRLTEERMHAYKIQRWRNRSTKRLKRFDTDAKRLLLVQLVHGQAFSDDNGVQDAAEQALNKGVPAVPATLAFAQWLDANASQTADRFQEECMNYTGEGSSPLDAFNTQIQGMVKKLSQFITMMKKYASPDGIQHLEDMIDDFADMGMEDIFKICGMKIVEILMSSVTSKVKKATGGKLYEQVNNISFEASHKEPLSLLEIGAGGMRDGDSASARSAMFRAAAVEFEKMMKNPPARLDLRALQESNNALKHQTHTQSELLAKSRKYYREWKIKRSNLSRTEFMVRQDPGDPAMPDVSGIWEQVGSVLHEMEKVLPTSIELLKFARKEVSAVAANLDSIFGMLGKKGFAIFQKVADAYAEVWVFYFIFVFLLNFSILLYGFWASGFWGGPAPLTSEEMEKYEPPRSFWDRCKCCCYTCCQCCASFHDTQSCFWSCIILFQVVVLLLFIMSLVFCILAGIQMFMGSSCMQIYVLGDNKVCTESLDKFATFLATFQVGEGEVPLTMACDHHNLKTCNLIHDKMFMAGILTVAGSFLAVFFNFELIFGIAIIHERAIWRRRINEEMRRQNRKERKE